MSALEKAPFFGVTFPVVLPYLPDMDEKVVKLLNVTSIPAVLVIFYMELQSIEHQVQQTEELTRTVVELRESIKEHCHSIITREVVIEEEQQETTRIQSRSKR